MRPALSGPLSAALLLLATLVLLTGCDLPPFEHVRQTFAWTEEGELSRGWLIARDISPEPAYCYRTLARPDCHAVPEPFADPRRLIDYFGPPPE